MLPRANRLSRKEFSVVQMGRPKSVSGLIGTLKFNKSLKNKLSVVVSSKNAKSAVVRNRAKRAVYSAAESFFKTNSKKIEGIIYLSKDSYKYPIKEIKSLVKDLLNKAYESI